jgi:hypothetical protein
VGNAVDLHADLQEVVVRGRERIMAGMEAVGRGFVVLGIVLVVVGFVLTTAPSVPWLGKLPGDLRFDVGNVRVHLPLATSLLLSVVLTLLLQLFSKLR